MLNSAKETYAPAHCVMENSQKTIRLCIVGTRGNRITADFINSARKSGIKNAKIFYIGKKNSFVSSFFASLSRWDFDSILSVLRSLLRPGFRTIDVSEFTDDEITSLFFSNKNSIFLVCGCGRIITKEQLDAGFFINYHNSLLPAHRGLRAVSWARYEGTPVGYTFHEMSPVVDVGRYIFQRIVDVKDVADPYMAARKLDRDAASQICNVLSLFKSGETKIMNGIELRESYHSRQDCNKIINIDYDNALSIEEKIYSFGNVEIEALGRRWRLRRVKIISNDQSPRRLFHLHVENRKGVCISFPIALNLGIAITFVRLCIMKLTGIFRRNSA